MQNVRGLAREKLSLDRMRAGGRLNARAALCLAVLFLLNQTTEARTRRYRKQNAVVVALQPFLLARSVVHAVADPIVFHAPRVAAEIVTAPIRIASRRAQPVSLPIARALPPDLSELDQEQNVRAAEPVEDQPIQLAYFAAGRRTKSRPPPAERSEPMDDDDEDADDAPRAARAAEDGDEAEQPSVFGNRAVLRGGIAYAPSHAPQSVKNAIWAVNTLRRKPYVWGGGHDSFHDDGYDCSGTVSFALHGAGALDAPLPSSDLMRYGERGRGRWITIYSRPGHTFAVIAGLRLDTTDFQRGGNTGPRWHLDGRETRGYVARHPAGM